MSDTLNWRELNMGFASIPAASVAYGEYLRLVMDSQFQMDFIYHVFPNSDGHGDTSWQMWLETEAASYPVGTPEFSCRIGSMIRHRGLLANLSLRENLLLPFLYRMDHAALLRATEEVDSVAEWLGMASTLDERAGERSSYTHALVSLGRCMLAKPAIIIAQEVHIGMSPERLAHFRELAEQALQQLGSGLVYLTATEHEGSGLAFSRTLTIDSEREMLAFRNLEQNDLPDLNDLPDIDGGD
ncbi:MAG TPA: hypothetical protein VKA31_08930 [Mariprofundaceae bacterium]|nr:hypothetical protein [Mariprofundaceae bacterium]